MDKWPIIDPPAKHHLNGFRWRADHRWPNIECWLGSFIDFSGDPDTTIAKKPYIFVIFLGCRVQTPWPHHPLWIRAWYLSLSISGAPEALRQSSVSLYPVLEFSNETGKPVNGSLVLQKGDNLNITCYSHLKIQWVVRQGSEYFVSMVNVLKFRTLFSFCS